MNPTSKDILKKALEYDMNNSGKPTFTKYQLADQMRNYMHVDDKFLEGLVVYSLNHISGKEFSFHLQDGQFSYMDLKRSAQLIRYSVIYHNCTPYNAKRAVEVRLSFRAALPEYNLEPIVLVEIVIPFTAPESGE